MIGWIVLGLIAGLLAKFIIPGDDPGGLIVTILIGIAGAYAGGWLGKYLDFLPAKEPGGMMPGMGSIATATIGAILLLAIYRKIFG
ncbi:membrane protein [Oceaniferula spumae]|uniref:Membrane protein n=1 Tax=Oceaniferula spumae TaxID=2979115 RepID=A0AAT9FQQ6_9BACT